MINKKIKKLKKKNFTEEQMTKMTNKVKEVAHKKISQEIFEKDDLLKIRREKIKKRKEKL